MAHKIISFLLLTVSLTLVSCGGSDNVDYSSNDQSASQRNAFAQRPVCSENDKQAIVARIAETVAYPEQFVSEVQAKRSAYRALLGCVEHLGSKTLNRALQMGASDAAHNRDYNQMLMEHGLDPRGSGPFTGGAQNFHCAQEFSRLSSAITRVANGEGSSALRSIYADQYQILELGKLYSQMGELGMQEFFSPKFQYSLRLESAKICLF